MSTSSLPGQPDAQAPSQSFPARLIGVFFSPGETFADIARKPDWIAPLVLTTVVAIVGTEIFLNKIGMRPITEWAIEHSSRQANVTPEQIDQAARIGTIFVHVFGVIWVPLVTLVIALIGLVIVNSILGTKISFKTALAISCYAYIVTIVGTIIGLVMVLAGAPEHIISNPQNPTPLSLGFFLNPLEVSKPLLSLATSFEITTFWFMGLLGIGYSEATSRKVKAASVFLVFLGLWIVWTLIKMGWSLLGS